jgi:hypothetical protein
MSPGESLKKLAVSPESFKKLSDFSNGLLAHVKNYYNASLWSPGPGLSSPSGTRGEGPPPGGVPQGEEPPPGSVPLGEGPPSGGVPQGKGPPSGGIPRGEEPPAGFQSLPTALPSAAGRPKVPESM